MMKSDEDERTFALLIGSGKCHPCQGKDSVRISMKGGIIPSRIKNRDQEGAWAETDLSNMQHLLRSKRVADDDISKFNYKERNGRKFANGKNEITTRIQQLFEKDGKHYILYYTGHGDLDGSWVFPVTRRATDGQGLNTDEAQHSPPTPQGSLEGESGNVPTTPNNTAGVDVHEPIGNVEDDNQVAAPSTAIATVGVQSNQEGATSASIMYEVPEVRSIIQLPTEDDGQVLLQVTSVESDNEVKHKGNARPIIPDTYEDNELITFEDIIDLWTKKIGRREDCFLMIISDCCHAGNWVQELDSGKYKDRRDIFIQAACCSSEICKVSKDQQSSKFTKYFVAAHSLSFVKKVVLAVLDHAFVLNIVSMLRSNSEFSPISSRYAPFGEIEFYDSFDDMYLSS